MRPKKFNKNFFKPYALIGVKALVLNEGRLLLLRRSPEVTRPGEWNLPGGKLEIGEQPIDGIKREVKEETGLEVDRAKLLDVRSYVEDYGFVLVVFYAVVAGQTEVVLDWENDHYEWFLPEEIEKLPVAPAIRDMLELVKQNR